MAAKTKSAKPPRQSCEPVMIAEASSYRGRGMHSNSGSISSSGCGISSMLSNIDAGISPIQYDSNSDISVTDAVKLCQKAYWNVAIFKSTIDIMSEFANSTLHFKGKNKVAVKFYEDWYKRINGHGLGDQCFRELFRSSNLFLYRVEGEVQKSTTTPFAKIPLKYIVLNPADIRCDSAASFIDGSYKKILNQFEVEVLKKSNDLKNIEFKKSLPPEVQRDIENGKSEVSIPLGPDSVIPLFFKKQDYEALAVPMYFPVLFDINLKLEFKKAEQIIARACEYMILLINVGDEQDGVDPLIHESLVNLMKQETVGRVLISDHTTKMSFIMPDLNKILGPNKYEAVNSDIANGLMNIFFGEQKYADSMIKIKVFLERLNEARKLYLNEFLIPEMEKIASRMGFREVPTPVFEEIDLRNETEYMKIYNRMYELGILTPEETINAFQTNLLPENYDSLVSQEKTKQMRDKGLYLPPVSVDNQAGRPEGTPQNQKDKTVTPVGQGSFSFEKLKDVAKKADELINIVSEKCKEQFKIKRMSKNNKDFARSVSSSIITNELIDDWFSKVGEYVSNPIGMEVGPVFDEIVTLAAAHNLDYFSSALLFNSKF